MNKTILFGKYGIFIHLFIIIVFFFCVAINFIVANGLLTYAAVNFADWISYLGHLLIYIDFSLN